MFGVYFFVRIIDQWRVLERTLGVLAVVKFGTTPACCPDEEIAVLLARANLGRERLSARPPSTSTGRVLTPGAVVAIADGPLRGLSAVYAGMSAPEREMVLLDILGGRRPVEIAARLDFPSLRVSASLETV